MALHNELGKTGEQLAADYLCDLGYSIIRKNWRHSRYEIDLIALKDEVLHFIEVKTRRSQRYGLPEDDVDRRKLKSLIHAGEAFLTKYPYWKRIQFDILSITISRDKNEYFFIEDVYV